MREVFPFEIARHVLSLIFIFFEKLTCLPTSIILLRQRGSAVPSQDFPQGHFFMETKASPVSAA